MVIVFIKGVGVKVVKYISCIYTTKERDIKRGSGCERVFERVLK